MSKKTYVEPEHKAVTLFRGAGNLNKAEIYITKELDDEYPWRVPKDFYEKEAEQLHYILTRYLPGGTYDALAKMIALNTPYHRYGVDDET